ncbi:hypothetical protein P7E02_16180 [Enterococcus hulanensis]|uniref:hypothetical protein n=1 Tax=Enterococcus TaxID=1350 RepID=UPI000B7536FB|nr:MULTISPECIES: hypothetical protein [Enterococcus]MBO0413062.1 hypothetical protein [Enterococcus hulanensis]MDT2661415.1 hypothetical protein [Enterococcus hulanensis]OTO19938.1 hypothetical protein A5875_001287 [Enterococcus sp. 3H8_DIV0648]
MEKKIFGYLSVTFSISWSCWLLVAYLTNFMNIQLFSLAALPYIVLEQLDRCWQRVL